MLLYVALGILFVWLAILSFFLFQTRQHYFHLVRRTGRQRLDEILETLLAHDQGIQTELGAVKKEVGQLIDQSKFYFQKLGLVRYNAFSKTTPDQSFVLALLDKESSGIIVNFIYTHDGVRIYTKRVKQGKGEEYQLSEEEQTAIKTSK
ncbi:hypothetical protein A3G67_02340 [Candidatus Roizmanbacteria bacterium RIFCSPLOWO2_12_FULL_40_12]|uniref:DUF4446 domain-containing protein n=1 Tax=Candidatus Roizmanbacteria bacterium RIFCSPLOWO2_01_FULL_40_42 TaxID=1802066 RepID=A0A1F7J4X8_9BACT|nr:MAG: hypothetical protein A2779_01600 [Candidatus Roizmanbacteria bacterium RIFCSPHIGHO2_01_FULL_40_98]OGK29054.1 MAG: hypothetical protein A3C31_02240 [Candidatus Roizmanbacteria bacterium RIFCSPHIGHO2_02_FULL_40_53]OGK29960.1 MAG: hypothetical protein A2W49_00025 [Candidatus Roizmanbacteria bacterium RIFCSPHIGHO2_12_41_18]OGK36309.1 MAG: hypothetical protein A3E69_03685 [Candidatus Roizmanbacteria bacterium RIFCSPHIGHO2_12_FULL_40_130]OGK50681.1 MAG: hypothetical protein A3B50_00695 [Candi